MHVLHRPADATGGDELRVLATEVELAESVLSQARGLMFRGSLPEGFALVMDVGGGLLTNGPSRQFVHMLFMRVPIDVLWLAGDEVIETARLSPWTDFGVAKADRIVELPAGGADGVSVGDAVRVVESGE
jgi:uncharacterized membrane protein (UPF0127 family)